MFNLYETNEELGQVNYPQDPLSDQLLRICKLRIQLCCRSLSGDGLVCVSNPVDTRLIEESKSRSTTERLLYQILSVGKSASELTIDASQIIPRHPCACGKGSIRVPLSSQTEKAGKMLHSARSMNVSRTVVPLGLVVYLNGKQLRADEFRGVTEKAVIISTFPRQVDKIDDIHLVIGKLSLIDTIMAGHDPYEKWSVRILLDTRMTYAEHGEYKRVEHSS